MIFSTTRIVPIDELPDDPLWLGQQPGPVIGFGAGQSQGADVLVADLGAAEVLEQRIRRWPLAALALVQVLRSTPLLPPDQGLDIESFAYGILQAGPEFAAWLVNRGAPPPRASFVEEPVLLSRKGGQLRAVLNRAETRNPVNVEMREGIVAALELLEADPDLERLHFCARGACFSTGGDLDEFGTLPDAMTAHWIRTVQSPARLLARLGDRVSFYLHGACIGSGIELPAFGFHVVAHSKTFFQMPELALGLIPGAGGTVSMVRRIGRQRLAWLLLSGRRINARVALEWGLIDEISDQDHCS